jgi:hypothetical protein
LITAAIAGAALLGSMTPAAAQSPQACAKRIDIIKHLTGQFHETPVAIGLSDNGSLLEILASTDGKTWTLLFSLPTGMSCLMATGQDWQALPRVAEVGPPA